MALYTTEEILEQFDECARDFTFLMLDNGYVYPADVRLHAYSDDERWALVVEDLGVNYRAGEHDAIQHCLYCFGNCLKRKPGTANEDFLSHTSDGEEGNTFDAEYGWNVNEGVKTIRIRDQVVPLQISPEDFVRKNIQLIEPPEITAADLLRSLLPEHRDLLLATEEELRDRVPADLPLILTLNEWHHPDLADDELPSQSETFQLIAEVLVSGDASCYRPTQKPNTHWSNWPEGGTL
jgi:hypothetical protein